MVFMALLLVLVYTMRELKRLILLAIKEEETIDSTEATTYFPHHSCRVYLLTVHRLSLINSQREIWKNKLPPPLQTCDKVILGLLTH